MWAGTPGQGEQGHAHVGGQGLQRRHQLLAERHQEQGVEDREGETERNRLAEAGDDRPLKHQDEAEVAQQGDVARLSQQPCGPAAGD
jgi:hypothetical protein